MSKNLTPVEVAAKDPASMRKAINAMCWACSYDPAGVGTWRQQVGNCSVKSCPLYNFRPRSKGS